MVSDNLMYLMYLILQLHCRAASPSRVRYFEIRYFRYFSYGRFIYQWENQIHQIHQFVERAPGMESTEEELA